MAKMMTEVGRTNSATLQMPRTIGAQRGVGGNSRTDAVAATTGTPEPGRYLDDSAVSPPAKLRVLLVDDHAVVRVGLRTLIAAQPDLEVVAVVADGAAALEKIERLCPDIIITDISMPGVNGIELSRQIQAQWPDIRILALSMHEDQSYLVDLLEAGVAGYVLKRSAAEDLIRAIRVVAAGGKYLDPSLSAALAETLVRGNSRYSRAKSGAAGIELSPREEAVMRLIAEGFANKEISTKLSISVKTVETYKARSMEKLGLAGRADIVRYALKHGWLRERSV